MKLVLCLFETITEGYIVRLSEFFFYSALHEPKAVALIGRVEEVTVEFEAALPHWGNNNQKNKKKKPTLMIESDCQVHCVSQASTESPRV